jgi:hypothetical protein
LRFDVNNVYGATTLAYNAAPVDTKVTFVSGTYTTGTFVVNMLATSSTANYATLVVYDGSIGSSTTDLQGIVLVGYITTAETAGSTTGLWGGTGA